MDLVHDCTSLVRRIENLDTEEMSSINYMRSRSNIVYISAMAKRTHYAAYMAGVWSVDTNISRPFKAWMDNSAADGAISLYEISLPFIYEKDKNDGDKLKDERRLLSVFAEGAIHDAERFLEMADRYFPECAVTKYNKARVDIYYIEHDRVRRGVENLKLIPCPSDNSEAPELIWHTDNYNSFLKDSMLKERIQKETPENLDRIEQVLLKNYEEAKMRIDREGPGLWDSYHPYAKAALVGASTGLVVILYAMLGDVSLLDLVGVTSAHADVISAVSDVQSVLQGGGGLAASDFTRTMGFGGGGLA